MRSHVTDVGQHAEPARAIAEHELGRFPRVVRNRKGLDADVSDGERGVALDRSNLDVRDRRALPGRARCRS